MNTRTRRPLSLSALRAFEAVARRLNFSDAAEELFVTQSAVSRQIKGLEASTASIAIVVVGLLPMVIICRQIARERP